MLCLDSRNVSIGTFRIENEIINHFLSEHFERNIFLTKMIYGGRGFR